MKNTNILGMIIVLLVLTGCEASKEVYSFSSPIVQLHQSFYDGPEETIVLVRKVRRSSPYWSKEIRFSSISSVDRRDIKDALIKTFRKLKKEKGVNKKEVTLRATFSSPDSNQEMSFDIYWWKRELKTRVKFKCKGCPKTKIHLDRVEMMSLK